MGAVSLADLFGKDKETIQHEDGKPFLTFDKDAFEKAIRLHAFIRTEINRQTTDTDDRYEKEKIDNPGQFFTRDNTPKRGAPTPPRYDIDLDGLFKKLQGFDPFKIEWRYESKQTLPTQDNLQSIMVKFRTFQELEDFVTEMKEQIKSENPENDRVKAKTGGFYYEFKGPQLDSISEEP
jgi:hypothetical protein